MNFSQLHERLRIELLRRIERGSLTAALLAQQTGMQPPHISNFLHRKRGLSLPALDRVLAALGLSVADLLPPSAPSLTKIPPGIPLISAEAAMYQDQLHPDAIAARIHLPSHILEAVRANYGARRPRRERFVAVALTHTQAQPMLPILSEHAIVILDRHSTLPAAPPASTRLIYAVRLDAQLHFCYLSFQQNHLILRPHSFDFPVRLLPIPPQSSPSEFIVGRLVALLINL